MNNYIKGKDAASTLGVHQRTLYLWEEKGIIETIRTPGGQRLYNVEKFLEERDKAKETSSRQSSQSETIHSPNKKRLKLVYARVSSLSQKDDLERQKKYLKTRYPNHLLIEDIGSGMNLNKRGIRKIIKWAISGNIEELVIAHKDRLARFGYELLEDLIDEYSQGKIIVINEEKDMEPEEEVVKDMLQLMNIFVAKMNGLRKYKETDL